MSTIRTWLKMLSFTLLTAWMLLVSCLSASAEQDVAQRTAQVKAVFLFNFARYGTWPKDAFQTPQSQFVIGVFNDKYVDANVRKIAKVRTVGSRSIRTVSIKTPEEAKNVHLLFLSSSLEKETINQCLATVAGHPVLTVSDHSEFLAMGGMILFFERNNRIPFNVNMKPLLKANIHLSSKVLNVADEVFKLAQKHLRKEPVNNKKVR